MIPQELDKIKKAPESIDARKEVWQAALDIAGKLSRKRSMSQGNA